MSSTSNPITGSRGAGSSLRHQRQRGEWNMGCVLWAAVLIVAVVFCWEAVPVKIKNVEFEDFLVEQAKFSYNTNADQIRRMVLQKAGELEIPLDPKALHVERHPKQVRIRAEYVIPVEFPGYTWNWEFQHDVRRDIYLF
jgi:hypothetical protein